MSIILTDLPTESIEAIILFAKLKDIVNLSRCCKWLNSIINIKYYVKLRCKYHKRICKEYNDECHNNYISYCNYVDTGYRLLRHGICVYRFNNIYKLQYYRYGKKVGRHLTLSDDGDTIIEENYNLSGKLHGPYKRYCILSRWVETSQYKLRESFNYLNGKKHGLCMEYHKGSLYKIADYYKGKLHGELLEYCTYYNEPRKQYNYENNKLVGTSYKYYGNVYETNSYYDPTRITRRKIVYNKQYDCYYVYKYNNRNVVIEEYKCRYYKSRKIKFGLYRTYYPSGKIHESGYYANNMPTGRSTTHSQEGDIIAINNRNNGKRHGDQIYYGDGIQYIQMIETYDNGRLLERQTWFKNNYVRIKHNIV